MNYNSEKVLLTVLPLHPKRGGGETLLIWLQFITGWVGCNRGAFKNNFGLFKENLALANAVSMMGTDGI